MTGEFLAQIAVMLGSIGGAAVAIWRWMAKSIDEARKDNLRLQEARVAQAEKHAAESAAMLARYERVIEKQGEIIRAQKVTLDVKGG